MKKTVPSQKQKNATKKLLNELKEKLLLSEWDMTLSFLAEDSKDYMAEALIDGKYLRATVRVYPIFWKESEKEQREALIHELCHIISHPINDVWEQFTNGRHVAMAEMEKLNEQMTTRIERIAIKALRK